MSLIDEYKNQLRWRSWTTILDALPPLEGQTVLDLGCAIGDQSALLLGRGAKVIGIDANADLVATARARGLANEDFRIGNLRTLDLDCVVDGIWCSFTAAYLIDLPPVLARWRSLLRPGGWIALTEVDDLFGHTPLSAPSVTLLEQYVAHALSQGWYDFRMGRKLAGCLRAARFQVKRELSLEDAEFTFDGPASPEVLEAWRLRFERMKALEAYCGSDFARVRGEFLSCLASDDHRALTTVQCCLATSSSDPSPAA